MLIWFPPIFFFHVPAWLMLGYWFVGNFFSGTLTAIAETSQTTSAEGSRSGRTLGDLSRAW